jgi:hypothetical protein
VSDDRTKQQLQDELRARDLPVSGTKQELLDRLEEAEEEDRADDGGGAPRGDGDARGDEAGSSGSGSGSAGRLKPLQVARLAARQLQLLTGREVEGTAGLEPADGGWRVLLEVCEVARVPRSTDVVGVYEVEIDADGDIVSYERLRRYVRGQAGDDQ